MNPRFPLYIPSKGRAKYSLTSKALDEMGVHHRIVVEPQEYDAYAATVGAHKLLVLDMGYKDAYDTCDDGDHVRTGSGPARNFIWDHAVSEGHPWHWIMDDNIRAFYRMVKNQKIRMGDGAGFCIMEDFCQRYSNISMAGPNYEFSCPRKQKRPPFQFNTRIYSCNLIRCDTPYRWRGRYNEDTDLSLRMLKDGWCTILFNAFLQKKIATQLVPGGNTDEIYQGGTRDKSEMIVRLHPDVAKMAMKWGRWHHHVDYRSFQYRKLKRVEGMEIAPGVNDYGMKAVKV